jgi:hypothetical protein
MKSAFIFVVLLCARAAFGADPAPLPSSNDYEKSQRPPLEASSTTVCHLAEAKPILLKVRYNVIQYQRRVLDQKPLVLQEKLRTSATVAMTIETRGCEDLYAKFEFYVKDASSTAQAWLDPAAEHLRNMHVSPDSLVTERDVAEIAQAVANENKAEHLKDDFDAVFVCLERGKKECLKDVSIELKPPKLTVLYIDRP